MKHLVRSTLYGGKVRRFNESLQLKELEDLMDFAKNCLAYLLDEGFELELVDRYGREPNDPSFDQGMLSRHYAPEYFWIDLYGPSITQPDEYGAVPNDRSYTWNQIKDYYIPFLQLLKTRYVLVDHERSYKGDLVYFKILEGADVDVDVAFKEFKLDEVIDDKITLDSMFSVSVKVSSKKI
jgi:hypothetical protein